MVFRFQVIKEMFMISSIRLRFISYFADNLCPDRFSLTSDEADKNDFYEVHIIVPCGTDDEIRDLEKISRGALNVYFQFIPAKPSVVVNRHIKGRRWIRGDVESSEFYLNRDSLRFARIDVYYYYGKWSVREDDCSTFTLFKLFSNRVFRTIYFVILFHKVTTFFKKRKVSKRLKTPFRSKFEIYEALMNNDDFLRRGTFKKSDISRLIFGDHFVGEYEIYQKVNQSVDWIMDACLEDGEIEKVRGIDDTNPTYKVKGKGIHYFTLTKEKIKSEEENRKIQSQQVSIQNKMVWLTFLLVIATFLTALGSLDELTPMYNKISGYVRGCF